jgi:hypothetical protein
LSSNETFVPKGREGLMKISASSFDIAVAPELMLLKFTILSVTVTPGVRDRIVPYAVRRLFVRPFMIENLNLMFFPGLT